MPEEAFLKIVATPMPPFTTAFSQARVVQQAPWFKPRKICKQKCCAETVAISLDQDEHRLINTLDGLELADVLVEYHPQPRQIKEFFAPSLTDKILPCLQPGTIIHVENYSHTMKHFFKHFRPDMTTPYLIITSESDKNSPHFPKELVTDNLLIKWVGTNPLPEKVDAKGLKKLEPFPLGLSKYHRQTPYLARYLEMRNFTNPFRGKEQKQRWLDWASLEGNETEIGSKVIFTKFGINSLKKNRQVLFDALCGSEAERRVLDPMRPDKVSCQNQTLPNHEIYKAASTYLFGLSPPGVGWDCYRTYEYLLLGVIPIIEKRQGGSDGVFKDLPVIEVEGITSQNRTRDEYHQILRDYIKSPEFLENDFAGWDRMFLNYWRLKLLQETDRAKDVVKDEHGREYYQAWKYTLNQPQVLLH
jgi:hypothetical protein